MFLIAGVIGYVCYYFYAQQKAQYNYPKTTASIDSVYYRTSKASNESFYTTTAYVTYSYLVNGNSFNGSSVAEDKYGEELSITTGSFDKETIDWVKSQKTIEVYYNPGKPARSFIEPDVQWGWLVGAIISGLFSLLGLAGIYTSIFGKKKNYMLNEDQARQVVDETKERYMK